MLVFDSVTRGELNSATNKTHWTTLFDAAFGPNKRIRCYRNGVEFRNVGATGGLTLAAGKITKLGKINNTTVSESADVSTGTCKLRIEGNGRWMEGSLGPSKAAQMAAGVAENAVVTYDFEVDVPFTSTNGFGVTTNFSLSGYKFLPTGTGSAVPALTATCPVAVELWNWQDVNAPVLVGTIPFNNRVDDFIYQDAEMAAENGDIGVYQSTQSLTYAGVEFGAIMLVANPNNALPEGSESVTDPMCQILVSMAVRENWPNYPTIDGISRQVMNTQITTYPKPFKFLVKDSNGNTIGTIEQQDGMPVNDPRMSQGRNETVALRPHTNTGNFLVWWNKNPKRSSKIEKYYPGLTADAQRPSQAKAHFTFLSSPPLITGGYQGYSYNGCYTFWGTPKWPLPYHGYADPIPDPYLSWDFNRSGGSAYAAPWACGWGYEPGSTTMHDVYTGPGGPRQDRCVYPSILSMYISQPNGSRPQGNVPWRSMALDYCKAYFNHSNHWVRNVKTFELAPMEEFDKGLWDHRGQYYGDGGLRDATRAIDYVAVPNGAHRQDWNNDKTGRMIWGGWARDGLHSYTNAGWGALLFNSPCFAIGSKFDTITQIVFDGDASTPINEEYMKRSQAWSWMHHVIAWKLASAHPTLGITREMIETRMIKKLESMYDRIYYPAYVQNSNHIQFKGMRNLGCWPAADGGYSATAGGGLGCYIAGVLQLMKQTGMWKALKDRVGENSKAWIAMRMHINNFDNFVFGYIVDTRASFGHYVNWGSAESMPESWAAFEAARPATGQEDWLREANGKLIGERDVADHLLAQYAYIRRDFFPEIPHPKLQAACDKFDFYYNRLKTYVLQATTPEDQRGRDHLYRYPGVAPVKAPTELGPA